LKDLKTESLEYETVEEFLVDFKKKFRGEDDKIIKVAELKRIEQENRMMEEFVQKFIGAARKSRYEERLLVE